MQLAVLDTASKDTLVQNYLAAVAGDMNVDSPGFLAWIGGHQSSDSQWKWTDGQAGNVSFQVAPEPFQHCASVGPLSVKPLSTPTLRFNAQNCLDSVNFICQKQVASCSANQTTCQIGQYPGLLSSFGASAGGCNCFFVYGIDPEVYKMPWEASLSSCQKLGATLAIFENMSVGAASTLVSAITNASTSSVAPKELTFWLGLRRRPWVWVNNYDNSGLITGEALTYTDWFSGPSDTVSGSEMSCMAAGAYPINYYGWSAAKCDNTTIMNFICELRIPIVPTTEPSSWNGNSTATDNEAVEIRDWAAVIVPCAMVVLLVIGVSLSVACYLRLKRRQGYSPQP
jgi:hypothetical protein